MKKVYIVTSGEYSSYGIDAVFSREELAEEYKNRGGGDYVEEFPLDEPIPEAHFHVMMDRYGNTGIAGTHPTIDDRVGFVCFTSPFPGTQPPQLMWIAKTGDKQKAIKIVNEKRTQILALHIWGNAEKVKEMISN